MTEPGRYTFRFGWLTITAKGLAVWEQFPNAAFALVSREYTESTEEFHLGSFELRDDTSPEEK